MSHVPCPKSQVPRSKDLTSTLRHLDTSIRSSGPKRSKLVSGPFTLLLILSALILLTQACTKKTQPHKETRFLMGTLVEVVAYPDGGDSRTAVEKSFQVMDEVVNSASPGKEASQLARIAAGEKVTLSGHPLKIMETSLEVLKVSGGAFDPTLGELVSLWGFGSDNPALPESAVINNALKKKLQIENWTDACCPPPGTQLDLGGVAKGYAVDEAVRIMVKEGVSAGIVNAGGDLRSFGKKPGGKPWKIGIQDPGDPQKLMGVLEIGESAVATSGDYQRYFEKDGIRYHHILDPATGYPADSGVRSATVIAPDCILADALATAAFVLGPDEGIFLLEGWQGVEGVLVDGGGAIHTTSGIGSVIPFERRVNDRSQ